MVLPRSPVIQRFEGETEYDYFQCIQNNANRIVAYGYESFDFDVAGLGIDSGISLLRDEQDGTEVGILLQRHSDGKSFRHGTSDVYADRKSFFQRSHGYFHHARIRVAVQNSVTVIFLDDGFVCDTYVRPMDVTHPAPAGNTGPLWNGAETSVYGIGTDVQRVLSLVIYHRESRIRYARFDQTLVPLALVEQRPEQSGNDADSIVDKSVCRPIDCNLVALGTISGICRVADIVTDDDGRVQGREVQYGAPLMHPDDTNTP